MPLFFVMSGMFFTPGKYSFGDFLQKRVKQLIVPLGIFTIINLILEFAFIPNTEAINCLLTIGAPGALWFLWALFSIEVVYAGIGILFRYKSWAMLLFALCIAILAKYFDVHSLGTRVWNINAVLAALPCYAVGSVFSEKLKVFAIQKQNKWKTFIFALLLLIVPLIVTIVTKEHLDLRINQIPYPILLHYGAAFCATCGIFAISKIIEKNKILTAPLSYLGRNTIPIIGLNLFCVNVAGEYFVCDSHFLYKILEQCLIWSVCLFAIWFCNRYFRVAVGKN